MSVVVKGGRALGHVARSPWALGTEPMSAVARVLDAYVRQDNVTPNVSTVPRDFGVRMKTRSMARGGESPA